MNEIKGTDQIKDKIKRLYEVRKVTEDINVMGSGRIICGGSEEWQHRTKRSKTKSV